MPANDMLFLGLVLIAFGAFGGGLAYQSYAEWRWKKRPKG